MESSRILQALVMHHAMLAAFDSKVSGGDFGLGDEEDLSNLKEQAAHSMAMHGPGCRIDFQSFCRQKKEAEVDQERNKKMRKQIFDLSKHLMSLVSFTQAVVISRAKKPQLTPRTQMPLKRQMFGRDVWGSSWNHLNLQSSPKSSLRSVIQSFLVKGIKSSSRTTASRRPLKHTEAIDCFHTCRILFLSCDRHLRSSKTSQSWSFRARATNLRISRPRTILGASLHSCYTEVGLGWFRQIIPIALIPLDTFAGSHGRIQEVAEGVVSIQGSFLTPCSLFPHTVDIDQYDLDRISQYSMGSLSCGKWVQVVHVSSSFGMFWNDMELLASHICFPGWFRRSHLESQRSPPKKGATSQTWLPQQRGCKLRLNAFIILFSYSSNN